MIRERNQAHFRERKPTPKLKSQPKVIQDSDFQVNPVWLWVSAGSLPHHLVCVSHFSECRKMADDCMSRGGSTLGPGGAQAPPNVGQAPPDILVPTAKIRILKI